MWQLKVKESAIVNSECHSKVRSELGLPTRYTFIFMRFSTSFPVMLLFRSLICVPGKRSLHTMYLHALCEVNPFFSFQGFHNSIRKIGKSFHLNYRKTARAISWVKQRMLMNSLLTLYMGYNSSLFVLFNKVTNSALNPNQKAASGIYIWYPY